MVEHMPSIRVIKFGPPIVKLWWLWSTELVTSVPLGQEPLNVTHGSSFAGSGPYSKGKKGGKEVEGREEKKKYNKFFDLKTFSLQILYSINFQRVLKPLKIKLALRYQIFSSVCGDQAVTEMKSGPPACTAVANIVELLLQSILKTILINNKLKTCFRNRHKNQTIWIIECTLNVIEKLAM